MKEEREKELQQRLNKVPRVKQGVVTDLKGFKRLAVQPLTPREKVVRVVLERGGKPLKVLSVHLDTYNVAARYQARFILMFERLFTGPNATPRNCELILSLLLNRTEQDPAIGDFLERYEQKRKRLGRRRAELWAYSDVLRTIWPVFRRKLGTLLKFAVAADWVRRQFHQ